MNKYLEIFKFEFVRRYRGMLMWIALWVLFNALILAFYDSLAGNTKELEQLLAKMPPEFLKAFGSDISSIASLEGIINSRYTLFALIIGGIWAGWQGAQLIGKDENTGALTWLVTQPVSRTGIYLSKLAALLSWIFLANFVIAVITGILADVQTSVPNIPWAYFIYLGIGLGIYSSVLAAIGNFGAVLWNEEKGRTLAIAVVILSYAINVVRLFNVAPEFIKYLTLSYYFNYEQIAKTKELNPEIWGLLFILLFLVVTGNYLFTKRNIGN
jgi:ABC-2 type transport system permease protein